MNNILVLIMALTIAVTPATESKTIVTKIHEDDQITVLTSYNGDVKERTLHGYDFNIPIELAENIPTEMAVGIFTREFADFDGRTYYQFKSYDGKVWWALTKDDIGFAPTLDKEYTLLYCDNGTTIKNKPCDCIPEWECECEVYDDILLGVFEK